MTAGRAGARAPDDRAPIRHGLEYGCYRIATLVCSLLPEAVASWVGAAVGWLVASVLRIRRRDTDRHLAIAFPDRSPAWRGRVARASYRHLGREAAFLARARRMTPAEVAARVHLVGFDAVRAAAAGDTGVVLLTAHLGNWELAGAAIASLGLELDVVGKGMANRRFERALFAERERLGMRVIEIGDAPVQVRRSLARGRVTAFLGDQNAHRYGAFVPFFGHPASTSRGTGLFAIRTRAPVFVGFAARVGPGHRYVLEAQRLAYRLTDDVERDVTALLEGYHRVLEDAIRRHPEQYFWQHRRWRTRPTEPASQVG